jgi:hypothetical protein
LYSGLSIWQFSIGSILSVEMYAVLQQFAFQYRKRDVLELMMMLSGAWPGRTSKSGCGFAAPFATFER